MYTLLDAGSGSKYRLTQAKPITERAIRVRVFDGSGFPLAGIPIALHYPDPALLRLDSQRLKTAWQPTAFFEYTDSNGVVEFPFDLHQGGPYTVWVMSVAYPSDGAGEITRGIELFFRMAHAQEAPAEPESDGLHAVVKTVLGILEGEEFAGIEEAQRAADLLRDALGGGS